MFDRPLKNSNQLGQPLVSISVEVQLEKEQRSAHSQHGKKNPRRKTILTILISALMRLISKLKILLNYFTIKRDNNFFH